MKLKISNFAKIGDAVINNSGITVIAGVNNTGKSTIGKILFALFDSLNNLAEKIYEKKKQEIEYTLYTVLRNYIAHGKIHDNSAFWKINVRRLSGTISNGIFDILDESFDSEIILNAVNTILSDVLDLEQEVLSDISELISKKVMEILNLSDSEIIREIITMRFNNVFNGQINNLSNLEQDAYIELINDDKKCEIIFHNNICTSFYSDYVFFNDAFYIDNPFIVGEIEDYDGGNRIKEKIIQNLKRKSGEDNDGLIKTVIAKEKLAQVYVILNKAVNGKITYEDEYILYSSKYKNPIKLSNLSTGLKSFVLVRLLLEKGCLKEKDTLILDEPEIHLHPEWEHLYAEIIVLLQKYFDLNITLTTHSSDFLEAIEFYSKKYEIYDKCNFYLADVEDNTCSYRKVTDDVNQIYRQMVQPSINLDRMNYEMEDDDVN